MNSSAASAQNRQLVTIQYSIHNREEQPNQNNNMMCAQHATCSQPFTTETNTTNPSATTSSSICCPNHQNMDGASSRTYLYRDFANWSGTWNELEHHSNCWSNRFATPLQLARRCKSSDLVFPVKLHFLLTASEQDAELAR